VSAPIPVAPRKPVPERFRVPQALPERGRVNVGEALDVLMRPPPGRPVTDEQMNAIRQSNFDLGVLNDLRRGAGTPETQLSIERSTSVLSTLPSRIRVQSGGPRRGLEVAPLQNVGRGTSLSDTTGLPGEETRKGAEIREPQFGVQRAQDQRYFARPGRYPQEDTPRPSVERAPEVSPQSQMVMGIGLPTKLNPPSVPLPVKPEEAVPLPAEVAPETLEAPPTTAPFEKPFEENPEQPAPTTRITVQPSPVRMPVSQPPPVRFPTNGEVQPQVSPSVFPTAERRLAPAGNTVTSPVVFGSKEIATSPSGGPGTSYQTSVNTNGDTILSWTRSDGSIIHTYQDPTKGGGAIHGATTTPVKTSGTGFSLEPSSSTLF
jgi:hypothetical protein